MWRHAGQRLVVVKMEVAGSDEALEKHFQAELSAASANHRCMVQLLGFCNDGKHRFLVYEHMANGPLSKWIFGQAGWNGMLLEWSKRLKLAIDIARVRTTSSRLIISRYCACSNESLLVTELLERGCFRLTRALVIAVHENWFL